jgi:hypothetical protein
VIVAALIVHGQAFHFPSNEMDDEALEFVANTLGASLTRRSATSFKIAGSRRLKRSQFQEP